MQWRLRFFALTAAAGVSLHAITEQTTPAPQYSSKVMIYDLTSRSASVVHRGDGVWEAPNWSRDRKFLLSNSNGNSRRFAYVSYEVNPAKAAQ